MKRGPSTEQEVVVAALKKSKDLAISTKGEEKIIQEASAQVPFERGNNPVSQCFVDAA